MQVATIYTREASYTQEVGIYTRHTGIYTREAIIYTREAKSENLHEGIATSSLLAPATQEKYKLSRGPELGKDLLRNAPVDHQTATSVEFYIDF